MSYQPDETDDHVWVAEAELPAFFEEQLTFPNQKQQILTYLQSSK